MGREGIYVWGKGGDLGLVAGGVWVGAVFPQGGGALEGAFDLFFCGDVEMGVDFGGFDVFVTQEVF